MDGGQKEQEGSTKLTPLSIQNGGDAIRATIGDFGRWQLKISILMSMVKLPIAWFQMSIVFLAPPMKFWCKKPPGFENVPEDEWRDLITRFGDRGSFQQGTNPGFCLMNQIALNATNNSEVLTKCAAYSYNTSLFTSTITSEWDLVCDRQKLMDFSQVSLMFGVLLGNILFGILADKHGRKKILLICLLFQSLFGIFASISPVFWLFVVLRFFLALANGGTMVTSFVICMEVVGGKWRTIVPILYQIPFGFGYASLAGLSYLLRDWRHFHFMVSVLSLPYVLLFWLIPESPRWLMVVGKQEQALHVLEKAAKENKTESFNIDSVMTSLSNECPRNEHTKISVKVLFSAHKLRKRSCLLCVNWAIAGITFYAFIQYMGHVSENLFLTVAVGGLISLPGTVLCVFLVSNYGRRLTITYSYMMTAACSLLILAFPKGLYFLDWPRVILAGIGIIGLSVSIPAMYLFTGELFPTVLRNSGVGFAMMFSRLGSMIAPLLVSLQNVAGFLPLLVIGVATVVQAVLVLPLPETHGKELPDTLEELGLGNHFSRSEASKPMDQMSDEDILMVKINQK